ncbi:MAG: hypothetical protein ACOYL6_16520 [Bacteriovoracaceae bacterium]
MKILLFCLLYSLTFTATAQQEDKMEVNPTIAEINLDLNNRCLALSGTLFFEKLSELGEKLGEGKNTICYRYKCVVKKNKSKLPEGNSISVNKVEVNCTQDAIIDEKIANPYRNWAPEAKEKSKGRFRLPEIQTIKS